MAAMQRKVLRLKKIIRAYNSCLVAFSAGVDSTFLLKVAAAILPKQNILAVTAVSAAYPRGELSISKKIAAQLGVRHKIIRTKELSDRGFLSNPVNRCYFCKKELFSELRLLARKMKLSFVLDATNSDDSKDYRPGNKAKQELGVCSPLAQARLTKTEIRVLSREMGLKTWDKPAMACLASRVAYGTKINPGLLRKIDQAEQLLRASGFRVVRLRHHGDLCRIEVEKKDIPRLGRNYAKIARSLKKFGYKYLTVDLEGYRTGSMNEVLK